MPQVNNKNEVEALFLDLDGTVYNTFEAIACIADVAAIYAKSYDVKTDVVYGLMRDNVDPSNFFNTDISALCYALGPSVANHALLKITNPQEAIKKEQAYIIDNRRRSSVNYTQSDVLDDNFNNKQTGEKYEADISPYQAKLIEEYQTKKDVFASQYAAASEADKKSLEEKFVQATSYTNEKICNNVAKTADIIGRNTFKMFDKEIEILNEAKAKGTKLIAMTDGIPMEVVVNASRAGFPLELFDKIYIRGTNKDGSKTSLDDVKAGPRGKDGAISKIIETIEDKTYYTDGWKPHGQKVLDICDDMGIDKKKVAFLGDSVKSDGGTAIQANEVSKGESDIIFGYARYGALVTPKAELAYWYITDKESYKLGVKTHDDNLALKEPKSTGENVAEVVSENGVKSKVVTLHSFADVAKQFEFVPAGKVKSEKISNIVKGLKDATRR